MGSPAASRQHDDIKIVSGRHASNAEQASVPACWRAGRGSRKMDGIIAHFHVPVRTATAQARGAIFGRGGLAGRYVLGLA